MNCSKIILPSEFVLNFYSHYTNLTLGLTLIITPLQFYIILTKSEKLGTFKWYILNYCVWCFLFHITISAIKPVILVPATGGFPLGIIRNGSSKTSIIFFFLGLMAMVNTLGSVVAAAANRYLKAFPSRMSSSLPKFRVFFYGCIVFGYGLVGFFLYRSLDFDRKDIENAAMEYDPCLEQFLVEPGFLYVPKEAAKYPSLLAFYFSVVAICLLLFYCLFFIVLILFTQKTVTVQKFQKTLILSSVIQISISIIFSVIPQSFILGVIAYDISIPVNFFCIADCLTSTQALFECATLLFFVAPYRNAVRKMLFKSQSLSSVISQQTNTSVVVNIRRSY